jgi:hypothetical protein
VSPGEDPLRGDFVYRAGCTALLDLRSGEVRYVIRTHGTIANDDELARVRNYLTGQSGAIGNAFDSSLPVSLRHRGGKGRDEPFALLHQLEE